MRFKGFWVSRASIVTTALVAAVAGVVSVMWTPPSERPLDAAIAQYTEDVEVVAPDDGLAMALASTNGMQLAGGDVVLELGNGVRVEWGDAESGAMSGVEPGARRKLDALLEAEAAHPGFRGIATVNVLSSTPFVRGDG